jgi:hypothetical protein
MDHLVWWDEEMMAAYRTENSPAARTLQEIGVHSSVSIYSSDEFNSNYICWYPKPMNRNYIRRFGMSANEYRGSPG